MSIPLNCIAHQKSFKTIEEHSQHIQICESSFQTPIQCEFYERKICKRKFKYVSSLVIHYLEHNKFLCEECGCAFDNEEDLSRHEHSISTHINVFNCR